MGRYGRVILVVIITAVVTLAGLQQTTQAQQRASGLQVSPTRQDLTAQPGDVKEASFVIRNITNVDVRVTTALSDFESDNETGHPRIIVDETQASEYSVRSFLRDPPEMELKPGESENITLTLDVPGNAAPGGYFGAIRFEAVPTDVPADSERNVALTASVAPLVFLEIGGEINEQIEIESVAAARDGKSAGLFFSTPNQVRIGINNLGNSFARPFGRVVVENMFGSEVTAYELNNTSPRGAVLPESSRTFTDPLRGVKLPGRYQITAAIAHADGGEVISYQASFWYVPFWFMLVILLLIGAIIFAIRRLKHRRPRPIRRF